MCVLKIFTHLVENVIMSFKWTASISMSTILDFHTSTTENRTYSHQIFITNSKSKQIHREMSACGFICFECHFHRNKLTPKQHFLIATFFADIDEILRLCYLLHVDSFLFLTVDLFAKKLIQHNFCLVELDLRICLCLIPAYIYIRCRCARFRLSKRKNVQFDLSIHCCYFLNWVKYNGYVERNFIWLILYMLFCLSLSLSVSLALSLLALFCVSSFYLTLLHLA